MNSPYNQFPVFSNVTASSSKRNMGERGFTLVEIAIVLVIIGLMLGGILGGQSLIRSAQAKDAVVIASDLRTATAYFKQRYSYLPGDLPNPTTDIVGVAATTIGTNGNGNIEGTVNAAGQAQAGSEVAEAPFQLYRAGFLDKLNISDPQRRIGTTFGPVHITVPANSGVAATYAVGAANIANATVRHVIVFVNLPCDVAREIDIKVDDGDITTGRANGNACVGDIMARYAIAL